MLIKGPNNTDIFIENIILDLNGTLANYGRVKASTKALIKQLESLGYRLILLSGDIRGNAKTIADELGIDLLLGASSDEKALQMQQFDSEKTVAIGNARIDIGTFRNAIISIATIQAEGIHVGVLNEVDILVTDIDDALRLLTEPKSLEATLRV